MTKESQLPTYEQMNATVREAHALNRSFLPWYVRYRGLLFIAALAVGAIGIYGYQHRRYVIGIGKPAIVKIERGIERIEQGIVPIVEDILEEWKESETVAVAVLPQKVEESAKIGKGRVDYVSRQDVKPKAQEKPKEVPNAKPAAIKSEPQQPKPSRADVPLDEIAASGKCWLIDSGEGVESAQRFKVTFQPNKTVEGYEHRKRYIVSDGKVHKSSFVGRSGPLTKVISCADTEQVMQKAIITAEKMKKPKKVSLSRVAEDGECYIVGNMYAIEFEKPVMGYEMRVGYPLTLYSPFVVIPKKIDGWEGKQKTKIMCGDLETSLPLRDYYGYGGCVTLTLADGTRAPGFVFSETLREYGFFKLVKYKIATKGRNRIEYITHTPVAGNTPAKRAWECGYVVRVQHPNVFEDAEGLGKVHIDRPIRGE